MPDKSCSVGEKGRARHAAPALSSKAHGADDAALLVMFFEKRRSQLLWDVQRVTKSTEEAEDIVQESLLKAWRNLQQFRGDAQIGTWLRAIVKNTAREWVRNRGSRIHLSLETQRNEGEDPTVLEIADSRPDPERWCQRKEIEEILHSELEGLTMLSRRAIELCAIEEQSLRDAARTLNVGVIAVKSRLFRGRRVLEQGIRQRTGGREYCWVP